MPSLMRCVRILALAVLAALLSAQVIVETPERQKQREEILKLDHKKNLADAARLLELAQDLKSELDKTNRNVLPVTALRKAEEIEKLARSLRGRLKKF
jgi:hypothetical protein